MNFRLLLISMLLQYGFCEEADQFAVEDYEYVLKLSYDLNQNGTPNYIMHIIFDKDQIFEGLISVPDVLQISKIETFTLERYLQLFEALNISSTKILSIEGLEGFLNFINLPFKEFYDTLLEALGQAHSKNERNALIALEIDPMEFSSSKEYDSDEETFLVFKSGSFTEDNINKAALELQSTSELLFYNISSILLKQLNKTVSIDDLRDMLNINGYDKSNSDILIEAFNITHEDVKNITNFKSLLDDIISSLNEEVMLAAVTDKNKITVNKKIYDTIENYENLLKIFGVSVSNANIIHEVINYNETVRKLHTVEVTSNLTVSHYIPIAENITVPLEDCAYVSWSISNDNFSVENNVSVTREGDLIIFQKRVDQLILGSPLICSEKLYGLANDKNYSYITFIPLYGDGSFINNTTQPIFPVDPDNNTTHPVLPEYPGGANGAGTKSIFQSIYLIVNVFFVVMYYYQ